jgi:hypothetical protein
MSVSLILPLMPRTETDSSIVKKIDLSHSIIIERADGIVEIDCADNHEYTVEEIKQNLEQIKFFAGSKRVAVLNVAKPFTTTTREVRDFVASAPHLEFIKAEAFVIHTIGQSILGNFFLKINKPIVPAMFFKNKADAERWLLKF